MRKLQTFVILVILATVLASLYGIAHDQITYSLCPEYYSKFKFIQFGFEQTSLGHTEVTDLGKEYIMNEPRVGALLVGVMATWWFGTLLGSLLALVSILLLKERIVRPGSKAILIAIIVAGLTSICGYGFGQLMAPNIPSSWHIPPTITDLDAFVLVGHIHNFSYAGGLLGLVIGMIYLVVIARKYKSLDNPS